MVRTIKRYSNRKLYDTEDKRYITLEQIAVLVRENQDIKVIDNQTGEDLTTVTLSQILLEQEKRKETSLPKTFFTNLIQRSVTQVKDAMKNIPSYFDASFASEQEVDANVDKMVQSGEVSQDEAKKLKDELRSRTASFKKKLDDMIERRVQDVLEKLNIPTKTEISKLNERLDEITRKFETILKDQGAPKSGA
jgi:polyhydroxyalkanoate synthesis repressor PhaR